MGWWEGGGSWRPDWPRWAGEIGKWGGGRPSGEGWRREGHAEPAQWRPRRLAPLVVPELLVPSILARQGAAPLISTLQPLPIHHRSSLISRRRRPHPQLWAEQLSPSQRWPPPQVSPVTLPYSFPSPECGVGTAAWLKPGAQPGLPSLASWQADRVQPRANLQLDGAEAELPHRWRLLFPLGAAEASLSSLLSVLRKGFGPAFCFFPYFFLLLQAEAQPQERGPPSWDSTPNRFWGFAGDLGWRKTGQGKEDGPTDRGLVCMRPRAGQGQARGSPT